jgi:hypothetical protein
MTTKSAICKSNFLSKFKLELFDEH